MKVRRVYLKEESEPCVAVWCKEEWVPLLPVLKAGAEPPDSEEIRMAKDMIAFLQAVPEKRAGLMQKISRIFAEKTGLSCEIEDRSVLPFQPLSYRDFMLFEKHFIQASRGFARRFVPGGFRVAAFYERITGRVFPKFRPSPLWYQKPIYYMGNHMSFVPNGHPVAFPSFSRALDYELEVGAVIVREIKNADPESALAAVGGFVVFNDFSARDVQLPEMRSGFGPVKAKNFANSMSDVLVTSDEILPHLNTLNGEVRINGTIVSRPSTAGMYHSLGKAIAYASLEETLHPGEMVATGTLPGGCALENGHWLKSGDQLTLSIDRIGTLTTPILASSSQGGRP